MQYTYNELFEKLERNHKRGIDSKKVANNTYARLDSNGAIVIRYHDTDVVTLFYDGAIRLDSGGWKTLTTKERLNWFLPYSIRVYQESGIWYLSDNKEVYLFEDGLTISASGEITGAGSLESVKEIENLRKEIRKYCKRFAKAVINLEVGKPSGGDCWYCAMVTQDGETLGEAINNTDHFLSHFEESYFVPSLLYKAIQYYRVSRFTEGILYEIFEEGMIREAFNNMLHIAEDQIFNSLKKYLYRQFELA